ncbi:hypothetical protein [Methylomonas sp. UP202]|uniref:hypothetical protein n=1 Tax=Methylomonas sp. UP202 TaxID=3040943 RepID=UPI00247A678E|nr:hypothetical protein [Methylomonas sp. UP202]WGS86256.1 hypothetical protein QC632_00495 [Methylomonas sp. UP202]
MRWIGLSGLTVLVLLAGLETGRAEPKPAPIGDSAIKKAQGIIRQLSQEKSALEAEKAAWLADKATLEGKLKLLENQARLLPALQDQVERYKAGLDSVRGSLENQLVQQRQREQALLQKHNDMVLQARAIREDNTVLVQAVQERERWISQCGELNRQLREVGRDIVQHSSDKSLFEQLAELEPITGIAQVQNEAQAETYRYRLRQLKVTPFEAAVPVQLEGKPAAAPMPAEPASTGAPEAGAAEPVDNAESPDAGQAARAADDTASHGRGAGR